MNEFQSRKVRELQKPIPGCMGRMINIFDLSAGMAGTKLLTDKAHRDGSPVRRNRFDMPKKVLDPAVQIEDKTVPHEPRKSSSNKKSNGTPMKMLIAQEMSKETEAKHKSPSVVARLMGLDALPAQQSVAPANRITPENKHNAYTLGGATQCYRQQEDALPAQQSVPPANRITPENKHNAYTLGGATRCYRQQEDGYFRKPTRNDIHPSQADVNEHREYKDVYEVWQQPSRTCHFRDQPLSKQSYNDSPNEKRMALVRQKFMEAKRLATDQKLLQSKEFQDALEVLSSNRDLFLKFLEEPNSLFSKHLQELQAPPPPPSQMKHITVLKPSKTVEARSEKEMNRHHQTVEEDRYKKLNWSPGFVHPEAENLCQPTRIVVLKPSPAKSQDLKAERASPTLAPGLLEGRDLFEDFGTDETRGSREVAKKITQQMRESLSSNRRDENLLSSVILNGYIGDESSFNRSETEFIGDEGGTFSDSEIVTPTSWHSWDYINRFGSPYSFSTFSRASYSPESSVIREAKKRLSERWAMVSSNETGREQRQVRRSSSTLGEMLAIPEIKKEEENNGGLTVSRSQSCGGEQDLRVPTACLSISRNEGDSGITDSPKNLIRSKSLPVSSSAYENISQDVEVSNTQDITKSKSGKLSFKGKVSSLFFPKNKKPSREKPVPSPLVGTSDGLQSTNIKFVEKTDEGLHQCPPDSIVGPSHDSKEITSGNSSLPSLEHDGEKQGTFSDKAAVSLEKPRASENASENQDQPSPISVLEAPFEDDANDISSKTSEDAKVESRQLISRSPPIESVARSLSWDDAHAETTLSSPLKLSTVLSKADEDEEQYLFVQSLLASAGLVDGRSGTVLAGWHSLESPLDPLLLDKFLERKEEAAKCRERRSNQRLLFDCVNAALLDISWNNVLDTYPWARACGLARSGMPSSDSIAEEVWGCIKEWFSGEERWGTGQSDNSSLVLDRALKNEVAGKGWAEMMGSVIDEIGKEIEAQVLGELVGEALVDLIPRWS